MENYINAFLLAGFMDQKALILVFFTAIISGVSIFVNNFGVKGIDSAVFTFAKNIIVAVLLLSIILGLKEFNNLKRLNRKDWSVLLLIGLIGGAIPFVLFFKGLQLTNGAAGSFVHKLMFVFVAILAVIFLKEKLSWKIWIPATILLVGNFFLLQLTNFELNLGMALVLVATLFWSVENVISKHVLKTIEPKVLAFGRLFFGSLFIMAYLVFTDKFSLIYNLSWSQFSWILVTVPFLLLYTLTWYSGLKHVKVTTATSILLLGAPITTILSFVFLNSAFTIMQAIGTLLIIGGLVSMVLLLERKTYEEPTISTA
jgi:drug/metabolite transporter (DMT)-like permease